MWGSLGKGVPSRCTGRVILTEKSGEFAITVLYKTHYLQLNLLLYDVEG